MAPADGGEEDEDLEEGHDGEGDDSEDSSSRSAGRSLSLSLSLSRLYLIFGLTWIEQFECCAEFSRDEGGDGSESESDDNDLDEDYEDGEDGEDDDDEDEQSGVSSRKRKRKDSASSGDEDDVGEEELCRKVVAMLQRRKDLNTLKLNECKAYLRKHGLRLTGSKLVCIQRIQEHWRLRDGNGEKLYPKSSFLINCTGDVCTGDVILFKQRVYDKYDKVTRGGNIIGRRTIAGKVVKDSYGAAKKQHTFTVEILWSKGVKPLPALYPLLVKGRNLYKLKTFRQRWDNEMERSKVLAEKHRRGAAARHARAIEKAKSVMRGPKYHQNSHHRREPTTKWRKKEVKHKTITKTHKKHLSNGYNIDKPRALESAVSYSGHGGAHTKKVQRNYLLPQSMPSHIHCDPMTEFHCRDSRAAFHANRGLLYSSTYEVGSTSTMSAEVYNQALNRTSFFNHPYSNHRLQFGSNNSNLVLNQVHSEESFRFSSGMHLDRWKGEVFHCRTPGCQELAADGCVISCCWICCRKIGRRCDRHT